MKAALPVVRAASGFLLGVLALVVPFVLIMTVAVLRANVSHGTPAADDYKFAAIAIGLLTAGFAIGVAFLGRSKVSAVPFRAAAIAGAGAVMLLLITMMLVGEPLGFGGAFGMAAVAGALAAWVMLRAWSAPRPVAT